MKKIFLTLFSATCFFSFGQTDSTIFGLARTTASPESIYLAKIDPATGIVTNISSASIASAEVIPDAAIDPFHKIFYFVDQNLNLVGLSLTSGAIVSSHSITNSNGTYFDQFQFNCKDSTIYGLARTSATPESIYLAKIDPSTGVVTNISSVSIASAEVIPDAAIDPFQKVFYFVDSNSEPCRY